MRKDVIRSDARRLDVTLPGHQVVNVVVVEIVLDTEDGDAQTIPGEGAHDPFLRALGIDAHQVDLRQIMPVREPDQVMNLDLDRLNFLRRDVLRDPLTMLRFEVALQARPTVEIARDPGEGQGSVLVGDGDIL